MKRKIVFCILTLLLATSVLAVSCAEPEPAPAPTTPTPTPTAPPASAPTEIIFTNMTGPEAAISQLVKRWGDMIEEKSGGRVKFVYYWAATLIPPPEFMKGVMSGTVDVIATGPDVMSNFMPISYFITTMPFMGYPSMEAETEIYQKLYDKFPVIQEEYKGVKRLFTRAMAGTHIHTVNKAVRVPEDLKGVKVATTEVGPTAQMVSKAGGVLVELAIPDLSVSLTSGVAEGFVNQFLIINSLGLIPALPYHTMFGEGGISMAMDGFFMNEATFNGLPADVQQIVEEAAEWYLKEVIILGHHEIDEAMQIAKDLDQTFVELTPEEKQMWADLTAGMPEAWIEEYEAKGVPAQEIYDETKRLIAEYK